MTEAELQEIDDARKRYEYSTHEEVFALISEVRRAWVELARVQDELAAELEEHDEVAEIISGGKEHSDGGYRSYSNVALAEAARDELLRLRAENSKAANYLVKYGACISDKPCGECLDCLRGTIERLTAALERIASHNMATCDGLTEDDCNEAMREMARAALATAKEPATDDDDMGAAQPIETGGRKDAPAPPTGQTSPPVSLPGWSVGQIEGRTIYRHGELVGLMDTPELAALIVAAHPGAPPKPADAPPFEFDSKLCSACGQIGVDMVLVHRQCLATTRDNSIEKDARQVGEGVSAHLADVLLWALQRVNRYKSRTLAWRLHQIADTYDTRPTGQWEPKP